MNEVITGDCLTTLKTLEQNSVDCLVTDPPYGYSFMGKDWDKTVPSVDVWKECLRVLKPGAFAFVMSAPRQDVLSQMIVRLGMAGFDTSFTSIYWTYASGFPKAANVGKLVDKRLGAEREVIGKSDNKIHLENLGNAGYKEQWDITKAATPQAKALEGSYAGFQPKPAVEVIIVAMKTLSEKTYVDQALANGKGITWLDDARIPYQNEDDVKDPRRADGTFGGDRRDRGYGYNDDSKEWNPSKGRFPANLLVSDDVLNDGRITKSNGHAPAKRGDFLGSNGIYGKAIDNQEHIDYKFNDSGSYSRYFDLDKWTEKTLPFLIVPKASKSEKDKGLEDVPEKPLMGGYKDGSKMGWASQDNPNGKNRSNLRHNVHPTVKPLKLMSYLITLGSRQGDVILDPFAGSGTTCVAAKQLGRQYIGLELSPEYSEIARKRIEAITQTIL